MNKLVFFFLEKFLRSPRKEWLRVDSIFMVLGIIISVATLTLSLALFDGYTSAMKKIYFGVNSHIYFFNGKDAPINVELQQKSEQFLSNQPEVISFGKVISNQVMITSNGRVKAAILRGIDPEIDPQPTAYKKFVKVGSYDILENNKIVIGYKIARELNISLNDTIKIISPVNSKVTAFGMLPTNKSFIVTGFYKSGMHEYDSKYAFCNILAASEYFELADNVTMYEVKLKDDFIEKADYLAYVWSHKLDYDFQVSSWLDFSGNLFALLELEKWVIFIILCFLVLIASFNVISAVSSTIIEKKSELGIMRAFGASNGVLRKILLGRIMIISFVSILLGQILGYILSFFVSKQEFFRLKGEIYFIDKLYVSFQPISWFIILSVSLLIVFLASLIPLTKIEKMQITNILRGAEK